MESPESIRRHRECDTILQNRHGIDEQKPCKFYISRNGLLSILLNFLSRIVGRQLCNFIDGILNSDTRQTDTSHDVRTVITLLPFTADTVVTKIFMVVSLFIAAPL